MKQNIQIGQNGWVTQQLSPQVYNSDFDIFVDFDCGETY